MVALIAALWPAQWGGVTAFTVVSGGSMEPTYYSGDLVVSLRVEPRVGDVIVYQPENTDGLVVHRIIGGDSATGWETQGDGNDWVDPWTPTDDQVRGVVHWRIPGLGRVASYVGGPLFPVAMGLIIAGVLLWPSKRVEVVTVDAAEAPQPARETPAKAPRKRMSSTARYRVAAVAALAMLLAATVAVGLASASTAHVELDSPNVWSGIAFTD